MLAEWTAECSTDAPMLVVPWHDQQTGLRFVNLRDEPYSLAEIREAEQQPALGRALRALNAQRSPFLTAKCDAWSLSGIESPGELEPLRLELGLPEEDVAYAFTSYIDLLWRERAVFASPHQQQDRLDRVTRRAMKLPHAESALQCVLRPAMVDLGTPLEGFATTLYVTSLAPDTDTAHKRWAAALEDIVDLLRSREFEPYRTSATIDL